MMPKERDYDSKAGTPLKPRQPLKFGTFVVVGRAGQTKVRTPTSAGDFNLTGA